jgi:hypothetical protein
MDNKKDQLRNKVSIFALNVEKQIAKLITELIDNNIEVTEQDEQELFNILHGEIFGRLIKKIYKEPL